MPARWIAAIALLPLGCGDRDDAAPAAVSAGPPRVAPAPTALGPPPIGALDGRIPALTTQAVIALAPPPIAVVIVEADGTLRVAASGGAWARLTEAGLATAATPVASIDQLPAALRTIIEAAAGPAVEAGRMGVEPGPRAAGGLGALDAGAPGADPADSDGLDGAMIFAADPWAPLSPTTPLLLAHPGTPAVRLIQVLQRTGGALAVVHGGALRVFRIGFAGAGAPRPQRDRRSLDIQLNDTGMSVSLDGAEPTELSLEAGLDVAALTSVLAQHGATATPPAGEPAATLAVRVAAPTQVQALVDVLAGLDGASPHRLGLGLATPERGTIGDGRYGTIGGRFGSRSGGSGPSRDRIAPTVVFSAITVVGALDRPTIRRHIRRHFAKVLYCYETELRGNPDLAGTLTSALVIDERGVVVSVRSAGVSSAVSRCVTAVLKTVEFPRTGRGIVKAEVALKLRNRD